MKKSILHITDLHLNSFTGTKEHLRKRYYQEYIDGLVRCIISSEQEVDIIVVSGDFIDKGKTDNFKNVTEILNYLGDKLKVDNWTAQMFFNKGCKMVYAGQEKSDLNRPSLFDIDKVSWDGRDISPLISKLGKIAKEDIIINGVYNIHFQEKDVVVASYSLNDKKLVGIFNVGKEKGNIRIEIPNGKYQDLLNDVIIEANDNNIILQDTPIIFWVN